MPPAEDHPIHPSTQKGKDFRYGCWNRNPFHDAFYAPNRFAGSDGYKPVFRYEAVRIPFVMSRDCKYDMARTDNSCEGCKWINDGIQRVR